MPTTMSTQSKSARTKSVQSILCVIVGESIDDVEFVAFVEFVTSNVSVMVLVATVVDFVVVIAAAVVDAALRIADFSEKLATKKSAWSKLRVSISVFCSPATCSLLEPQFAVFRLPSAVYFRFSFYRSLSLSLPPRLLLFRIAINPAVYFYTK